MKVRLYDFQKKSLSKKCFSVILIIPRSHVTWRSFTIRHVMCPVYLSRGTTHVHITWYNRSTSWGIPTCPIIHRIEIQIQIFTFGITILADEQILCASFRIHGGCLQTIVAFLIDAVAQSERRRAGNGRGSCGSLGCEDIFVLFLRLHLLKWSITGN